MELQRTLAVLLSVFRGLILDTEEMLHLGNGFLHCDYEKVALSSQSRGLGVFLLDFPSICSGLERSLEIGNWSPMLGLPFCKKTGPTIFKDLFAKIFDVSGLILDEPCAESIRCLRQLLKFAKKLRIESPKNAVAEKYREFADIETQLYPPVLSWGSDKLLCTSGFPTLAQLGIRFLETSRGFNGGWLDEDEIRVLQTLDHVQSIFDRFARRFTFRESWFKPKHGPGAVSEQFGSSKFEFPSWPYRLESEFPFDLHGLVSHQIWSDQVPLDQSTPCKLIGVPKDYRGPRLIASEPICTQFVQQGLMNVIRENVKRSQLRHAIDFRSQEPSRDLALEASLTREFSTIDLSSASDRLSCAVVECLFRKNFSFLEQLNAARTPGIQYPDGKIVQMKKFAAQGAAFTFPVQSITYALICMGVIYFRTGTSKMSELAKLVRVYGDDMIVPEDHYHAICEILQVLQLKVNQGKSFHEGFFRESCGMDAYAGMDITPANVLTVFSEHDPNSLVSTVECANNLLMKGYWNASRHLLETIPSRLRNKLAYKDSVSTVFGVLSFAKNARLKSRWNNVLHRDEVQILTVESKVRKSKPDGHSHLFQWFLEKPLPDVTWVSGEVTSVKARYCLRWVPVQLVRVV